MVSNRLRVYSDSFYMISLTESLLVAKKIQKRYGKGYYYATRFFPRKIRIAIYALYGFVRVPDEMVDTEAGTDEDKRKKLEKYASAWSALIHEKKDSPYDVHVAGAWLFETYAIPFEKSTIFLNAMIQDTYKDRYKTYSELESYMYGSAGVIGEIISHIVGFTGGEQTLFYARKLGEAMQLTNFLRDVREDYDERGRVYLPKEDMDRYGVTEEMISQHCPTEEFKKLMKFEIDRSRELFKEADKGIHFLSFSARLPILLASRLYAKILDKIEEEGYDIFTKRVRVSLFEKQYITLKTVTLYLCGKI